ncbi:MAG: hypothetical protein PHE67_03590 [Campylobacterales bacterium]|nr:hypothetical protein [Campylobacterales bacterium]
MIFSRIKEYARLVKEHSRQDKDVKYIYMAFGVAFTALVGVMMGIVLKVLEIKYSGYIFWPSMAILYMCLFYIYWQVRRIALGHQSSERDDGDK